MRIGILTTGHTEGAARREHGDFTAMFARILSGRGYAFETWDVVDMRFPEDPHDADAWLVTGSKHGAYEDHPFIAPLEDLIRRIHAARVPLVGICFGHQIVAQALGGRVVKHSGGWRVGRTAYDLEGLGTAHVTAWHQDQVVEAPEGARVVGSSAHCAIAALDYGTMWTLQPHPEFTADVTATYVAMRRGTGTYPEALMDAAAEATALPLDTARVAERMAAVLEGRAGPDGPAARREAAARKAAAL